MARHAVAATAARIGAGGAAERGALAVRRLFPAARHGPGLPDRRAAGRERRRWRWRTGCAQGLAAGRARDAAAGSAALGAHRADMALTDARERHRRPRSPAPAQQKALLIGVMLGHAALIAEARGFAPLLLLDEPAVHLDPTGGRRCSRRWRGCRPRRC